MLASRDLDTVAARRGHFAVNHPGVVSPCTSRSFCPSGNVVQGRIRMRGTDGMEESLFTVAKLEDFVPPDHPLRAIAGLVNKALGGLERAVQRDLCRSWAS